MNCNTTHYRANSSSVPGDPTLRITRDGDQRSGKAIVSFDVGPGGEVRDTKVDAPAFQGTSLPTCVSGMVSHWAFPKSQSGGLAVSYPFVFVGG